MIDQDILDGVRAAEDYAARLPTELGLIRSSDRAEEVQQQLCLVFRMTAELRRQVDRLSQVLENRERNMSENPMTEQDQEDLAAGRELRQSLENNLVGGVHFCCMTLIRQALSLNAELCEYTETGVTVSGKPAGIWKIVVVSLPPEVINEEAAEKPLSGEDQL